GGGGGRGGGGGAKAERLVGERWVPEDDRSLSARGAVVSDYRRLDAEQAVDELARVRDRRRRQQELRLGAVDLGRPPQTPEAVCDVGAEDTAVDMRLVDDHVAEVREHVSPAVVVWEHADMEHVWIGQDEVRPAADLPATLRLGVAVVDCGSELWEAEGRERAELVLRQRLGRGEVEGAVFRLPGDRVEDRQGGGEGRFARG